MKISLKSLAIIVALTAMIALSSCGGPKQFANLPSGAGINRIALNKAMCRMAVKEQMNGLDGHIDGIEVVTAGSAGRDALFKRVREVVAREKLENYVYCESAAEEVCIYGKAASERTVSNLLLVVDSPTELNVVSLEGDFSLVDSKGGMVVNSPSLDKIFSGK